MTGMTGAGTTRSGSAWGSGGGLRSTGPTTGEKLKKSN